MTCWSVSCPRSDVKDWPVTWRKCLYSEELNSRRNFLNTEMNGVSKADSKRHSDENDQAQNHSLTQTRNY